jgi:hypothetical protein
MPSWSSSARCTTCRSYRVFNNSVSAFSSTLPFPLNQKWSSLVHSMHSLNALLPELYRTFSSSVSSLCLPLHSSSSRVFSNSEASFESVNPPSVHSLHVLFDSVELICAFLALATKLPMFCCALLAQPK